MAKLFVGVIKINVVTGVFSEDSAGTEIDLNPVDAL